MAEIRPFRALRFDTEKAGKIEELVCPPYDIISETDYSLFIMMVLYCCLKKITHK